MVGDELVIVGDTGHGLAEIYRHELSTPGHPLIVDAHYPRHPAGNGPKPPRPGPAARPREPSSISARAPSDG